MGPTQDARQLEAVLAEIDAQGGVPDAYTVTIAVNAYRDLGRTADALAFFDRMRARPEVRLSKVCGVKMAASVLRQWH